MPEKIVASARKRGRKKLRLDQARRHAVTCRLTDAELDRVDLGRGADLVDPDRKAAISRGEYIRLAALKAPPRVVPEINREAWVELARTAANLNQAMAAYNAKGNLKAGDLIIQIRKELADLRLMMIGGVVADDDEGAGDESQS